MKIKYLLTALLYAAAAVYPQVNNRTGDLRLEDAITAALKNNPAISSAEEKIKAADARILGGISLPAPELSAEFEEVPDGIRPGRQGERSVGITQPLEFPLNYFLRYSKNADEKKIAEYEFQKVRLSVISAVKTAYYQVLAKKSALDAARQNMELAGDFLSKAELRLKAGEGTRLEQLTAKVQSSEALINSNLKENELKSVMLELNYAMGLGSHNNQTFNLSDSLLSEPVKLSFEELYKTALEYSPELKINELRVSGASTEKKLAWASLFPNFNLSYFKMTRDGEKGFYGASFGITVPLWFMFDQKSRIQESAANENAATADFQNSKNYLYLKLNSSFNEYQNALKQVELFKYEILPLSEEVYQTALRNYEAGEISYLEFLQARQTSVSAQYDYIDVLLSYNKSVVALEETIGKRIK